MTYPGLVLLVGVGIGLATFLYYMFAEDDQGESDQRQQYSYADDRTSAYHDDWRASFSSPRSGRLSRRNSSLRESGKGRNYTSKEDINNCSICQYALDGSSITQVHPCRHIFHKDCFEKLKSYTPGALCPNCRRSIAHAS